MRNNNFYINTATFMVIVLAILLWLLLLSTPALVLAYAIDRLVPGTFWGMFTCLYLLTLLYGLLYVKGKRNE